MGNIETTPEEVMRAKYLRMEQSQRGKLNKKHKKKTVGKAVPSAKRRRRRRKGKSSVRAVSGGLPSLGKRR
jgi:hypothetical protein